MSFFKLPLCLGAAVLACVAPAHGSERESNAWPFRVDQLDADGHTTAWQGVGPLFFSRPLAEGGRVHGFRPFWVARENAAGQRTSTSFLYPIFFARTDDTLRAWSVLNLINHRESTSGAVTENTAGGFDVWPFYFSRDTGSPETSYRAFFPIAGEVHNRFYRDHVSWLLFPFYLRTEARGVVAKSYVWPFVRTASGGGVERLALWPLLGWRNQAGVSHEAYYLWPLMYRKTTGLDTPAPTESGAVLPFYAYERSPEVNAETFVWPFFGYVNRTAPYRYREVRYLWPLLALGAVLHALGHPGLRQAVGALAALPARPVGRKRTYAVHHPPVLVPLPQRNPAPHRPAGRPRGDQRTPLAAVQPVGQRRRPAAVPVAQPVRFLFPQQ
jgi:hypothetical protein